MPNISIYNQSENRYYTVTVDINSSILDVVNGSASNATVDYYLKISTTMKKSSDKSSFPIYVIRSLSDIPAGYPAVTNFTDLVDAYVSYFVNQAELGMSTSSSYSSSSSSSEGYSLSSISSFSSSSSSSSSSSIND